MKKLLISLLTCAFILGHDVSAQAFSYEFDPDDIFMPADALHVFHGFDVRSEINDLKVLRGASSLSTTVGCAKDIRNAIKAGATSWASA